MYLLRCDECFLINHLLVLFSAIRFSLLDVSKSLHVGPSVPLQSCSAWQHTALKRLRGAGLSDCM